MGDVLCDLNFDQLDIKSRSAETTSTNREANPMPTHDQPTNVTTQQETKSENLWVPDRVPAANIVTNDPITDYSTPQCTVPGSNNDSQYESTPWSVLTSPDARELETANLLLDLVNHTGTPKTLQNIDTDVDNAELVPIGVPPMEDITKNKHQSSNDTHSDDSDKTVDNTANLDETSESTDIQTN